MVEGVKLLIFACVGVAYFSSSLVRLVKDCFQLPVVQAHPAGEDLLEVY
jgi:hypothetical protein